MISLEKCSICLENQTDDTKELTILRCKHVFHQECLKTWFKEKKSCPVCRKEICTPRPKSDLEIPNNDVVIPMTQNYVEERRHFSQCAGLRLIICALCSLSSCVSLLIVITLRME